MTPKQRFQKVFRHVNLFGRFVPKFVKQYVDLSQIIEKAFKQFKDDIEKVKFPEPSHGFQIKDEEFNKLKQAV